jgi:hypothetical protein
LQHRLFKNLLDPVFRWTETDAEPAIAFSLDEHGSRREATITLKALLNELQLAPNDPDLAMLEKVREALDFVSGLRIGDPLPAEVLTGDASWAPDPEHYAIARNRLKLQLATWAEGTEVVETDTEMLIQIADDPTMEGRFAFASLKAGTILDLNPQEVGARIEALVSELAFIEALREWLHGGQKIVSDCIAAMAKNYRGDRQHMETLTQVHRLAQTALSKTNDKMELVDAQTGEIINALRNGEATRSFLRKERDLLYRAWRAWKPYIEEWRNAPRGLSEGAWMRLGATYKFLAPRYMAVKEWLLFTKREEGMDKNQSQFGRMQFWY